MSWSRRARARSAVCEHWLGFAAAGGALAAVGLVAVGAGLLVGGSDPSLFGLVVGAVLLVAAPIHVALGAEVRRSPTRLFVNYVLGVVYLVVGVAFLAEPYLAAVEFEGLLVAFFLVHGLALAAFGLWISPVPYWYAVVGGGAVSVVVGVAVLDGSVDGRPMAVVAFGLTFLLVGVSLVLVAYGGRYWMHPLARGDWF